MLVFAALALAMVVGITIYDITIRMITGRPFGGSYDIVEACFAALVFLALPEIFRNEGHIRVDLIDGILSPAALAAAEMLARLATLAFILVIAWAELSPFQDAWRFGDRKYETGIPVWTIWLPVLAGTALSVVGTIAVLWRRSFRRGGPSTTEETK